MAVTDESHLIYEDYANKQRMITHAMRHEILQQVEGQKNGHTVLCLVEPMPDDAHDNTQVGIAFIARVDERLDCQCNIAVKRCIFRKGQRSSASGNVSFHRNVPCASQDSLRYDAAHVDQRKVETMD